MIDDGGVANNVCYIATTRRGKQRQGRGKKEEVDMVCKIPSNNLSEYRERWVVDNRTIRWIQEALKVLRLKD